MKNKENISMNQQRSRSNKKNNHNYCDQYEKLQKINKDRLNRIRMLSEDKRKETREKQINKLNQKLQKAREDGFEIGYTKCKDCGETFGYIKTQRITTKDGIWKYIPIHKNNIPSYCCESCRKHYLNTHKNKKHVKSKLIEVLITRWRGSGNYSAESNGVRVTQLGDNNLLGQDIFNEYNSIDAVDLSETFNHGLIEY